MGQKVHPESMRVGYIHDWKSNWFNEKHFADYLAEDVAIRNHITGKLSHAGLSDITIRKDLYALSVFLQYARKQGWCASNPVRDVEIPSDKDAQRFTLITPEMEFAYFKKCIELGEQDLHDLGRLMILQGARPGEVLAAAPADVDLERAQWSIPRGKTDQATRTLHLTDEARSIFANRMERDPLHRWLFPSPRNSGYHLAPLNDEHDNVLSRLPGMQRFVLYDLRETCGVRCAAGGMPLPQLQLILGHTNLMTTAHWYVHIQEQPTVKAMCEYGQSIEASAGFSGIRDDLARLRVDVQAISRHLSAQAAPSDSQIGVRLIELPIEEARAEKWRRGRLRYGGAAFVGNPLEELDGELLDSLNYVQEVERQFGVDLAGVRADLTRLCGKVRGVYCDVRGAERSST
ncbi:MAG: tyrosine-type recombinase/integrase [Acidobacteria bacterium]|nr:tyrosine-type recombinase/integrase [Acidobacteriota bacterium]